MSVPDAWPWKGSGKAPSSRVRLNPDAIPGGRHRLRVLIRKARQHRHGGAIALDGREYSVAQLTAALKKVR